MITIKQIDVVERERCTAKYDDKKERQNICFLFFILQIKKYKFAEFIEFSKHHFDTYQMI
jgi:hypothetical protein